MVGGGAGDGHESNLSQSSPRPRGWWSGPMFEMATGIGTITIRDHEYTATVRLAEAGRYSVRIAHAFLLRDQGGQGMPRPVRGFRKDPVVSGAGLVVSGPDRGVCGPVGTRPPRLCR